MKQLRKISFEELDQLSSYQASILYGGQNPVTTDSTTVKKDTTSTAKSDTTSTTTKKDWSGSASAGAKTDDKGHTHITTEMTGTYKDATLKVGSDTNTNTGKTTGNASLTIKF